MKPFLSRFSSFPATLSAVALVVGIAPPSPAAVRTWIHGGANTLWSNPANWSGGALPAAGDSAEFTAVTAPGTTSHDLGSGLSLAGLRFTTAGYLVGGQSLGLGTVVLDYASGLTRIASGIAISANQSWDIGTGGLESPELRSESSAGITLNGRVLTVRNRGTWDLRADILEGSATGLVLLQGTGRTDITSTSAWAGNLSIAGGTVVFDGTQTEGICEITGGTLAGGGQLNGLTLRNSGTVQPGIDGSTNDLGIAGDVEFLQTSVYRCVITGTNVDTLVVGGVVRAGGSFVPAVTVNPTGGTVLTVIDNLGAQPIQGTFADLAEGTTLRTANRLFRVSYRGGDGNDMVLTTLSGEVRVFNAGGTINSDSWGRDVNWVEDSAPAAQMNLVFPRILNLSSTDNTFADNTVFGMLRLENPNYPLVGARLLLNHGIESVRDGNTPGESRVSLARVGLAASNLFVAHPGARLTVTSPVDLNGHTLLLIPHSGAVVDIANSINESGQVFKDGVGTLLLGGTSTFTSGMTLIAGTTILENRNGLGATGASTIVQTGATLELGFNPADGPLAEPLSLAGLLRSSVLDGREISGAIGLSATGDFDASASLRLSGPVSGAGDLNLDNDEIILSGTQPNAWVGGTSLSSSVLTLQKSSGVAAIPGNITVGERGFLVSIGREQIADAAVVTLDEGDWEMRERETISGLVFTEEGGVIRKGGGPAPLLVVDGPASGPSVSISVPVEIKNSGGGRTRDWTVAAPGSAATNGFRLSAPVSSPDNILLRKLGPGLLSIVADNTVPLIECEEGSVFLDGSSPDTILRLDGGDGSARGTLSRLEIQAGGGLFSPASAVTPAHTSALLTVSRLSFTGAAVLEVDLNGTQAGSQFDTIAVTSTPPVLGNAALSVVRGFSPTVGTQFRIVDNQTGGAVVGTFAGLPEGAGITLPANVFFSITYAGGDGNDVVLTRTATAPVAPILLIGTFSAGTGPVGEDEVAFSGTGQASTSYLLQAGDDLTGWTTLQTITTAADGAFSLTIAQIPGISARFYRLAR